MPSLVEALREAIGDVEPIVSYSDIRHRVRRRRARKRGLLVASLIALTMSSIVVASMRSDDSTRQAVLARGDRGVFAAPTDTVLVFDDGTDGIVLVDLDRRIVERRRLAGQLVVEFPYRFIVGRDALVAGSENVMATPFAGNEPRRLGEATYALPGSTSDSVWLVTYPDRRYGLAARLEEVSLSGVALRTGSGPDFLDGGLPAVGLSDGSIAYSGPNGVYVWDPIAEAVLDHIGTGPAVVGPAHGTTFVWCEAPCQTIRIFSRGVQERAVDAPPGAYFDLTWARISPDGKKLAVATQRTIPPGDDDVGATPYLVDVRDGAISRIAARHFARPLTFQWSPVSGDLFFSEYSWYSTSTRLGRYDVSRSELQMTSLPFGAAMTRGALDRAKVGGLFSSDRGPEASCPEPRKFQSHDGPDCSYKF